MTRTFHGLVAICMPVALIACSTAGRHEGEGADNV